MNNNFRSVRAAYKITQRNLAAMIGVSQRSISYYESGIRKPSPDTANRIASIFNLSIEEVWNMFYKAS